MGTEVSLADLLLRVRRVLQGLNTTPVHGHAALFGVYGMLGIGLMLFALRALDPAAEWKESLAKFGFWATTSN